MKKRREPTVAPLQKPAAARSLTQWMSLPVSGASLALFRIGVGIVMILEAYSLWHPNHGSISSGKSQLENYFTGSDVHFNFPFALVWWLPLLPKAWIYAIVWGIAVSGLTVALGLFYRASIAVLFLTYGYMFSVESIRTYWQSYYYLEFLLLFLLMWMPAGQVLSLDSLLARKRGHPMSDTIPFWPILLLRGQLIVTYFYAGVAKLNQDWILDAAPVRWFLREPGVLGPYKRFFSDAHFQAIKGFIESDGLAYFLSYTGLIFDLAVGFLFIFRRTRILALVLMLMFHATNHLLIFDDIEWFPLVGAWTALIFLYPDWPLRFWAWIKKPFIQAPDWKWFWSGFFLAPVVGGSLGWSFKPTSPSSSAIPARANSLVTKLVCAWLVVQVLLPLRRFMVPADTRITYEGMSFSWRLKTEARRSVYHEMYIIDDVVLPRIAEGKNDIDWSQWHGEHTLYRILTPENIEWQNVPELLVIVEPILGERIIFNPVPSGIQTEAQARERLNQIWQDLYGRVPNNAQTLLPFPLALKSLAESLAKSGHADSSQKIAEASDQIQKSSEKKMSDTARHASAEVISSLDSKDAAPLRRTYPFALSGGVEAPLPFLIVEDSQSYSGAPNLRVNRDAWKNGPATRDRRLPTLQNHNIDPLVIYLGQIGSAARTMLPEAYVVQTRGGSPHIKWNSGKDLDDAKYLHTSIQPFYLRRYARRVASIWEKEYGRRPRVQAITGVSLNGRPFQYLVDPNADLASVSVNWFGHNAWIRDLEMPRIPRAALHRNVLAPILH
jgi:hypothetical protein